MPNDPRNPDMNNPNPGRHDDPANPADPNRDRDNDGKRKQQQAQQQKPGQQGGQQQQKPQQR